MIGYQKHELVTTYVSEIRVVLMQMLEKTGLLLQHWTRCERSLKVSCHELGGAILTQLILVTFETLLQIIK